MTTMLCDYCGDKHIDDGNDTKYIGLHLDYNSFTADEYNIKRNICILCWIKIFDTVLGSPIIKKGRPND